MNWTHSNKSSMDTHQENWGKCQSCEFMAPFSKQEAPCREVVGVGLHADGTAMSEADPQEVKSSGRQSVAGRGLCNKDKVVVEHRDKV